ncbi:hypothetical protein LTR62_005335 [Meristemomyces frigidus]|uniref:Rhodopsin domain-containing protein n=1 Tax=Meristemomyces frigidus TaxID=1508187 RepID=A0AAN7YQY7_9PEZI|nr:hypothetical protein LTR62_005335 [Meristemomyces frigidus]
MRIPPVAVLLTWPAPNYVDPVTHGPALLIVNAIFITLVCVAVTGRLYSRLVIKPWFGIDDTLILFAWVFAVGMTVVVMLANTEYGWDRHEWDIEEADFVAANKVAFIAKLLFTLAATFTRLSLVCFYYRLLKDSGLRWLNWVLHVSLLWTMVVGIGFVCLAIWLCVPIQAYWVFPPDSGGRCLDEGKVLLGSGIINCFSDLLTTVLPIPIVARLQMPRRQRIGVCILLCLGFIVTIAGIIRTYFIWKSLVQQYDETWWAYPLWIAAAVEIDLAVICACAPAWKSLLQQPIATLSSKLSSKLSSFRSPHSSSRGTPSHSSHAGGKPSVSNPLRSLPWFQITRLGFEKTDSKTTCLEKSFSSSETPIRPNHHIDDELELQRSPHSDPEMDYGGGMTIRSTTPSLQIMMRRSLEQQSAYVDSSAVGNETGMQQRRSGQWLAEKLGMKRLMSKK